MLNLARFLLSAALLLTVSPAAAQSGGPDASSNFFQPALYDWVPLAAEPGAASYSLGDEGTTGVALPWSIDFYGVTYNDIVIGSNGAFNFGTTGSISFSNTCLPTTSTSAPDVAVFWEDLNQQSGGIYSFFNGMCPFNVFFQGVACQVVQLELYRSAALTAEAELMVLRLALGAADGDCACLQEAWLIAAERSAIAEANLSARAALPSTIAEPTAQEAEPNLGSQLRQMEQLADACGRQASMQRREASASQAPSERSSKAMATAESETRPACEARHGHHLLRGSRVDRRRQCGARARVCRRVARTPTIASPIFVCPAVPSPARVRRAESAALV